MENKEEVILNDLLEDLKYFQGNIKTVRQVRLLILSLDLYVEYFINKLYQEKLEELKNSIDVENIKNINIKNKATHLIIWKVVEKIYLDPIMLIYNLRCKLVHNLKPNINDLENKINKIKPAIEGDVGLISKFIKNADPWDKIQIYIYPTIVYLYRRLKEIRGEKVDYTINFYITPDAGNFGARLIKI